THSELFPGVQRIIGDRDGGLGSLGSAHWDAVVDCCGYVPRVVQQSVDALLEKAGRYLFVSSISVYAEGSLGPSEESPVATLEDTDTETIDGRTYGPLKALCERVVLNGFGDRGIVVRPGL